MGGIYSRRVDPAARLDGKTAIVTGSNCGIGLEIARELCSRGAHVVLACRSKPRAEEALKVIASDKAAATGSSWGAAEFAHLDLQSLDSVRSFAESWKKSGRKLDVLVCNAGLNTKEETVTGDGFELTFQVNYLGHFLLTALLLDTLRSSGTKEDPARVVNLSSCMHRYGHADFESFARRPYPGSPYGNSKLAQVWSTRALARRLEGSAVTVNSCHPGAVNSEIWRFFSRPAAAVIRPLMSLFFMSTRAGAQNPVFVAASPSLARTSGAHFNPTWGGPYTELVAWLFPVLGGYLGSFETAPCALARDDALCDRFLARSLEWAGLDASVLEGKKGR
eukprot:tig00021073_g18021.t1